MRADISAFENLQRNANAAMGHAKAAFDETAVNNVRFVEMHETSLEQISQRDQLEAKVEKIEKWFLDKVKEHEADMKKNAIKIAKYQQAIATVKEYLKQEKITEGAKYRQIKEILWDLGIATSSDVDGWD